MMSGFAFGMFKLLPPWLSTLLSPLLTPMYTWAAGRSAREVSSRSVLFDVFRLFCYLHATSSLNHQLFNSLAAEPVSMIYTMLLAYLKR
jgi:hypothetical protein